MKAMQISQLVPPSFNLGSVCHCEAGIAKSISVNGQTQSVYTQAAHLSPLKINDEVLFQQTSKGIFIYARALKPNESPSISFQNQNNTLVLHFGDTEILLQKSGEIKLKNKYANLVLKNNGQIEFDAKKIKQRSCEDIQLNAGRHIKLNCPN